jgi:hypothetical protein
MIDGFIKGAYHGHQHPQMGYQLIRIRDLCNGRAQNRDERSPEMHEGTSRPAGGLAHLGRQTHYVPTVRSCRWRAIYMPWTHSLGICGSEG